MEIDRDDPVASVSKIDKASAFELSEDGYYEKLIASDEEKKLLNEHFHREIANAKADHEVVFSKNADNYAFYRSDSRLGLEGKNVITLPIVSTAIDLMVSWFVVTVMRLTPSVSFLPWSNETFKVPVRAPQTPENMMGGGIVEIERTTDQLFERPFMSRG